MRFDQKDIEAWGCDWENAQQFNSAMDDLRHQRREAVNHHGSTVYSKTAWMFVVLRQSLTYRIVDLGNATIAQLNAKNILSAIVIVRSLVETTAIIESILKKMRIALDAGEKSLVGHHDLLSKK